MAKHGRHIPKVVTEHLLEECNGRCANPGCQNTRVQFHHIQHWAVYRAHDSKHMIAVCPTCHDACHHGQLQITDDTLYAWKKTSNTSDNLYGSVNAEPGQTTKLLIGTFAMAQIEERNTKVFQFSQGNQLDFSVEDSWLTVSTKITDLYGNTILRVKNNKLTLKNNGEASLMQRPGKFTVTVPAKKFHLPAYALFAMRNQDKNYGKDDQITALDLEVTKPGHIRVKGFWIDNNRTIVVTEDAYNLCYPGEFLPKQVTGAGEETVFIFNGPLSLSAFC